MRKVRGSPRHQRICRDRARRVRKGFPEKVTFELSPEDE